MERWTKDHGWLKTSGPAALGVIVLLVTRHDLLLHPRFWAEEATVYYKYCAALQSLPRCLGYVYTSGLNLMLNVAVYVATLVPVLYSPLITTLASLGLFVVVLFQASYVCGRYGVPVVLAALVCASIPLLPATYETAITMTNAQWIAGLSMLLVVALPPDVLIRRPQLTAAWVLFCCLSGPAAALIAPVLAVRLWRERSLGSITVFGAAAIGLCVQLAVIHLHPGPRPLQFHFIAFPIEASLQTIIAPLFSVDFATGVAGAVLDPHTKAGAIGGVILLGLGVFVFLARAGWESEARHAAVLVLVAWAFVTAVQEYGQVAPLDSISGWRGARYFLFGSLCLLLMCALLTGDSALSHGRRLLAGSMLVSIFTAGAITAAYSRWPQLYLTGPPWVAQVMACEDAKPCRVTIWPVWSGSWVLTIVK